MANWRVTFTTYEDYDVEAETEDEAIAIAERLFTNNRCRPIANTWYDERDVECLDEDA